MQGQPVAAVKEKKDVLGGGSDGGYTMFWNKNDVIFVAKLIFSHLPQKIFRLLHIIKYV